MRIIMEIDSNFPVEDMVKKALYTSSVVMGIAVSASIILLGYLLLMHPPDTTLFGTFVVWVGTLLFIYATITEEHMMKELYLKSAYFLTGLLAMFFGAFFVSIGGVFSGLKAHLLNTIEFGIVLTLFGSAIVILSTQKAKDYSKNSGMLTAFSGVLVMFGGILMSSANIVYIGILTVIYSAVWMGLRSEIAQ
jgi:hypothetical protein